MVEPQEAPLAACGVADADAGRPHGQHVAQCLPGDRGRMPLMPARSQLPAVGLYAITPEPAQLPIALEDAVRAAIAGGAALVQYRAKQRSRHQQAIDLGRLLPLCRNAKIALIVNDHVDLAAEVSADGVHLGEDDLDPASARQRLGEASIVGVSCYDSLQRARDAITAGADYVAFGSFFPTRSKAIQRRPEVSLLAKAHAERIAPVVAIGGIEHYNGGALLAAGAQFLAVIAGLFGSAETTAITAAGKRFQRLFAAHSSNLPPAMAGPGTGADTDTGTGTGADL